MNERSKTRRATQRVMVTGGLLRRAFTMVEMVVVIILIGILASLVLPRMTGTADRAADAEAETVRRLMTTMGERTMLGGQSVAIEYDPERRSLSLLVDRESTAGMTTGTEKSKDTWTRMPLVAPVLLNNTTLSAIVVDGRAQQLQGSAAGQGKPWRLEMPHGRVRPIVTLVLAKGASTKDVNGNAAPGYQVDLAPDEAAARVQALPSVTAYKGVMMRGEDLDELGRREQAW